MNTGNVVIWVAGLLLVSFCLALFPAPPGSTSRGWSRWTDSRRLFVGCVSFLGLGALGGAAALRWSFEVSPDWFYYCLSWLVSFAILSRKISADPTTKSPWKRTTSIVGVVSCGAVLIVTVFVVGTGTRQDLRERYAQLELQLSTVRDAEVEDRETAWPLLLKMHAIVEELSEDVYYVHDIDEFRDLIELGKLDPEAPDLKELLNLHATAMELIAESSRRSAYRRELKIRPNHAFEPDDLPVLGSCRAVAMVLWLDGVRKAQLGDVRGALTNVRTLSSLGRLLAEYRRTLHMLCGLSMTNIAKDIYEHALCLSAWDDETLDLLRPSFFEGDWNPLLSQTLRSEQLWQRWYCTGIMLDLGHGSDTSDLGSTREEADDLVQIVIRAAIGLYGPTYFDGGLEKAFARMGNLVGRPYHECSAQLARIAEDAQSAPAGMITRKAVPATTEFLKAMNGVAAINNLIQIAYAWSRCAKARRREPAHLEALVPEFLSELPIDPFTGERFQLLKSHSDVWFYSGGKDDLEAFKSEVLTDADVWIDRDLCIHVPRYPRKP